jgi:beta-glucosidase
VIVGSLTVAVSLLPQDFRFGVATAGFQVEGGFNGPGEPANNWVQWERQGRVEPSGVACRFWDRFEDHLARARAMGCNSFRLGVEWARCEPEEGVIDTSALERYATILRSCRELGMEPLVTLHHFTHPAWLGVDFWLGTDSPERFLGWVRTALEALSPYCSNWVTINELNIYAIESYLSGAFPPGRRGDLRAMTSAMSHLLAAHVGAYEVIHELQKDAVVGTNNFCFSIYELDRMLTDILLARSNGVSRGDLDGWLQESRAAFDDRVRALTERPYRRRDDLIRRLIASRSGIGRAMERAVSAVYASPYERCLDVTQIDYYDPIASHHLRLPGHRTAGGRNWQPGRALWDHVENPRALASFAALNHAPGLDVWVVENGLCNRVRRGRSYPRLDGWDRPSFLRASLSAVVDALGRGVPVTGYWHWCLVDNYEWGSYEPRFGIYGMDRERDQRWLETDSMGKDAAGAYASLIAGLKAGDRSVLGGVS